MFFCAKRDDYDETYLQTSNFTNHIFDQNSQSHINPLQQYIQDGIYTHNFDTNFFPTNLLTSQTYNSLKYINIIQSIELVIDGVSRTKIEDNFISNYQHSRRVPSQDSGIFTYSFELDDLSRIQQPNGAFNFSRGKNKKISDGDYGANFSGSNLIFKLVPKETANGSLLQNYKYKIFIFTQNYNVLQINKILTTNDIKTSGYIKLMFEDDPNYNDSYEIPNKVNYSNL